MNSKPKTSVEVYRIKRPRGKKSLRVRVDPASFASATTADSLVLVAAVKDGHWFYARRGDLTEEVKT